MTIRFTRHAKEKIKLIQKYKFHVTQKTIIDSVKTSIHYEERNDGTIIAMSILDDRHVLRVVYKIEDGIIIIITCYPGRRKAYGI